MLQFSKINPKYLSSIYIDISGKRNHVRQYDLFFRSATAAAKVFKDFSSSSNRVKASTDRCLAVTFKIPLDDEANLKEMAALIERVRLLPGSRKPMFNDGVHVPLVEPKMELEANQRIAIEKLMKSICQVSSGILKLIELLQNSTKLSQRDFSRAPRVHFE